LIVPGPTAEGGWPFVKLIDVSSAGPKLHSRPGDAPDADSSVAQQFASPEQLQHGTIDFRSAIYSLGATMYFLLTGAAPPAKVRLRELRRFPKALRGLLAHILRGNPDERPQDLAALEKEILKCLTKIEKRHAFGRRLGIPLAATTPGKSRISSTPLVQVVGGIIVFGAVVVVTGLLAAFLLPADINPFRHRTAERQTIGVPIGVPDASPFAPSQATTAAPLVTNQPATNGSPPSTGASQSPSLNPEQGQSPPSSQPLAATTPPSETSQTSGASTQNTDQTQIDSTAPANVAPQPAAANESNSIAKKQQETAGLKRSQPGQALPGERDSESGTSRGRGARARVVGITSDGKLIFRLPSGRRVIVAPDSDENEFVPRRHSRFTPDESPSD
jgi:serine/threonine protein kinase